MAKLVITGRGLPEATEITPFRKRSYAGDGKYGVNVLEKILLPIRVSLLSLET
jgi:hypothetical protein